MQTDWRVFTNIPTLVILMGITRVEKIVRELLDAGRPADTPAAVIAWATTERQQVVRARLSDLPAAVKEADIESPAVIIVGPVAGLGEELAWYQRMQTDENAEASGAISHR